MHKNKKPSIHAPWRKRILIPLWVFQLALAVYQFGWSTTVFSFYLAPGQAWGDETYKIASAGITMFLGLFITIIIMVSIVQFSKFRLLSYTYQLEIIIVVILGLVSMAFVFSALDIFLGIFVALQVFFSIWLMVYAILVRRRVLRGQAEEMKRPVKGGAKVQAGFELGRMVDNTTETPPSYRSPSQESVEQKSNIRPSPRSNTRIDERAASLKEVREFV